MVDKVYVNKNKSCPNGIIQFEWFGSPGFGQLDLIIDENGIPHAYTEHMDKGEDKSFTKAVLMALLDKIIIEE